MNDKSAARRTISPFDGEPYTYPSRDEYGNPALKVMIYAITPEGARRADALAAFSTCMLWFFSFYVMGSAQPTIGLIWIVGLIAPFWMHKRIMQVFYNKLAKTTEVLFTPAAFQVKTKKGWEVYDRTLTHSFAMIEHDKTREERELHARQSQRDQMNRQVVARKRYYGDSYHITFMYMGQRFDVVTIYDQKRATAVTARLMACDKLMDTKNQMGEGEVMSPGEQWGTGPGGLPEE